MEGRDVAISNITGAFLQTDYDKGYIHINMQGAVLTLLEEIYPASYKYFIYIYSHRKNCIYTESEKAIYAILEASLLFWTQLSKILEDTVYQRNEYDLFVMKKI